MDKQIGLALGGGAVLGAAHVGVLKAIEEMDIKIDFISGTSIGAVVAAFYAFGKGADEIGTIAAKMDWLDVTNISLSRYGLLSNEKLGGLIVEHIGNKNIEDAKIPFSIVATDATSGEKVILNKGPLQQAVMASSSIPGIFKPLEIGGQMLVDGGVVENVPIETVKKLGAEYVIAVDLNARHRYHMPRNIVDVIVNSFHFLMKSSTAAQTQQADLLIEPDLSEFSRSDLDQIEALMNRGFKDAMKVLDNLSETEENELPKDIFKIKNDEDMNKEEFKQKAEKTINDLSARIEELKAKKEAAEDQAESKFEAALAELKEKKEELEDRLDKIEDAVEEEWDQFKEKFTSSIDVVKNKLSEWSSVFN